MDTGVQVQRMRAALTGAEFSIEDLWVRYYGLGGTVSRFEIESYLGGVLVLPGEQCDLLAEATNDLLATTGTSVRVPLCGVEGLGVASRESRRALGSAGAFLFTAEEQEQERLDAVTRSELLDTGPEARFDRITEEAKAYFQVSSSIVALIDDRRQFLKSVIGPVQQNMPRALSFCDATIRNAGPLIVRDALEDDRFKNNPLVLGEPYIRFYAGYPLRGWGGWTVGTLCVIDQKPREYSMRDGRKLRSLARQIEDEINGPRLLPDDSDDGAAQEPGQ